MPRRFRDSTLRYIFIVMACTSSGVGCSESSWGASVSSSAYSLHSSSMARTLICALASEWASFGATQGPNRFPVSLFVTTQNDAPTSVQTTGTAVKAASPMASGRPSEMDEFKNSHYSDGGLAPQGDLKNDSSTCRIFQHRHRITQASEDDVVAKTLGGENLLTLHRVRRRLLHISIDVEPVIFKSPFVDDDIGRQDGILNVLNKSGVNFSQAIKP